MRTYAQKMARPFRERPKSGLPAAALEKATMATVPTPAASWIVTYLQNIGVGPTGGKEIEITSRGLRCLLGEFIE